MWFPTLPTRPEFPSPILVSFSLAALLALFPSHAAACDSPEYRAFDFWLGEWQVHTTNGTLAGHNSIASAEGGCLLIENWRGSQGSTGQSYNYYNPATQLWRQIWVSQSAIIKYSGVTEEGAMHLEGTITYQSNQQQFPFRGRWIPLDNGSVRQQLEQWNPETEVWDDWFTGIYSTLPGD